MKGEVAEFLMFIAVRLGFAVAFFMFGRSEGVDLASEKACTTYGRLLKTETQYRDGECMFREGDGWVWLGEKLGDGK